MIPHEWEQEEDDAPWMEEYDEGFGEDSEIEDEDDEILDDDEEENSEDDGEDELEDLIAEGDTLLEEGEYAEALDIFRRAAERFPESPEAVCKAGHAALMLFSDGIDETQSWQDDDDLASYHEEALDAFETTLGMDEDFVDALNGLGALFMLTDNVSGACESWEKSLEIDPDQPDIESALEEARTQLDN